MTEQHTSKNIKEMLQNAAGEWHIDTNDMALTSDNAANMLVAADLGENSCM